MWPVCERQRTSGPSKRCCRNFGHSRRSNSGCCCQIYRIPSAPPEYRTRLISSPSDPLAFRLSRSSTGDRAYLKSRTDIVKQEAVKLNDKVKRVVSKLRRAIPDVPFLAGRFLLTNEPRSFGDANRPVFPRSEVFCFERVEATDVPGS